MKKLLSLLIVFAITATVFAGCSLFGEYFINGVALEEYTIVYSAAALDYTERAAGYLHDEIRRLTGVNLTVITDDSEPCAHEIVVGESNRPISAALDVLTGGFEFSIMADDNHVAIEGASFVIAAAAYYFVDTYIGRSSFDATIAKEATVHTPITKPAENYVLLIGDGMGFNQTRLFDVFSAEELGMYSDGESAFYGYMFPYQGGARTDSLSGTTDSAAAATALATGFKTINSYVGVDGDANIVTTLVELAKELGMATAVMSTESLMGATPASFTAHTTSRSDADAIKIWQDQKKSQGTVIRGEYGAEYDESTIKNRVEADLRQVLSELSRDRDGFFLMYEEAYFDKHSHANELQNTFFAGLRFNQIIGTVMEFAFYNPETFVLITADHETGGLTQSDDGGYYYTTGSHTSADVPVFAYGASAWVFDDRLIENIQIPKTFAAMWGIELRGYMDEKYPSLLPLRQ